MSNDDNGDLLKPVTAAARHVRSLVSDRRWADISRKAREQANVLEAVRARAAAEGVTAYEALRRTSPTTSWPTFQYWSARVAEHEDSLVEALIDRRLPPQQTKIAETVRASAITIRRLCPRLSLAEALQQLRIQYGEGCISRSSLLRIWDEAGLAEPEAPPQTEEILIEEFHGGAAFALLSAAELETGAVQKLAAAALSQGKLSVETQQEKGVPVPVEPAGRDERGRLTAEYNISTRAGVKKGEKDSRWTPDYLKRTQRDLSRLQVLGHTPRVIARKLMAIGVMALVTECRGFDGLMGVCGALLSVCCEIAYMPSTLDKFLTQLALLDVEDALWDAHARMSRDLIMRWSSADGAQNWLRVVIYIDSTQEPYWTAQYAKSGKISRTGRVGPCLSRITITGGPGIPLLVETLAGSVSLKSELPRILERVESIIGEGELGRFTIIDAEMATAKLLYALQSDTGRSVITVVKGRNVSKQFVPTSNWQTFRTRDEVREGQLTLHGDGAPDKGVTVRSVEMRRPGRHPHSTFFAATGKDIDSMTPQEIAEVYLTRWPNQEALHRNTRNGLGLDRSHGFGGEMVTHLAIDTKTEKAERQLTQAKGRLAEAEEVVAVSSRLKPKASKNDAQKAAQMCKQAKTTEAAAKKAVASAQQVLDSLKTMPREIYERDTSRENIVTATKMTVLLLIEFVLREYFGGLKIELRTFIEHFVQLPVTVRTSSAEIRYQIEESSRNGARMQQLSKACDEINRRRLVRGGKKLVFELVRPRLSRVELCPT